MSNYFSMGIDSRIGLGFDKRRTKSKCCNKCVYGLEGFKKMFCLRSPKVNQYVTEFFSEETEERVFTSE